MHFFMAMKPPTATYQEHKVGVRNGRPYFYDPPQVVKDATAEYRETNNWIRQFLDACCDIDKKLICGSGLLYQTYRNFCEKNGEFARSTTDFYQALDKAGFERKRTKKGIKVVGLDLKEIFE